MNEGTSIMPIYEFECSACHHVFERVMKVSEAWENLTCPECSAAQPKKLIGSCSFHSRERYEEGLARRMSARAQEK
jgi:putative FmdB family regulatory protein